MNGLCLIFFSVSTFEPSLLHCNGSCVIDGILAIIHQCVTVMATIDHHHNNYNCVI